MNDPTMVSAGGGYLHQQRPQEDQRVAPVRDSSVHVVRKEGKMGPSSDRFQVKGGKVQWPVFSLRNVKPRPPSGNEGVGSLKI